MPTLYRKYRPQTFAEISDQQHIVRTITNEIAGGKIAHAYLFSGPRGVGKTTIARLLAKSLNCANRKEGLFEPCNKCSSCQEINASNNIDVIEVDAASHTGVENVRENIIENAQFKPTKSLHKVFIIDEVHMLSTNAFNALLKTLEEPPSHVIFILATTEQHKLPETIISRCQRFNFKKISFDEMSERLEKLADMEKIKVDKKVFDKIIHKSEGCMRDAESLLGQILSLNLKKIGPEDVEMMLPSSDSDTVIQFVENIANQNVTANFEIIKKLGDEGVNLEQFLFDVIYALRAIMIAQASKNDALAAGNYSDAQIKKIHKLALRISSAEIVSLIEKAMAKLKEIKSSPIPELPLELLAVESVSASSAVEAKNNNDDKNNPPSSGVKENTILPPSFKEGAQGGVADIVKDTQPKIEPKKTNLASSIKETIAFITHRHETKTTLEEIQSKWQEIIEKISKNNHSLSFVLKMCDINNLNGDSLQVSVPYSFHKDKIEEIKNKKIIEDQLHSAFGEKIYIACGVIASTTEQSTTDADANTVATEFGGEVVS